MKESWNRRRVLKQLAATSAAAVLPRSAVAKIFLEEPASERKIQITSISEHTVPLSVLPVREGKTGTRSFVWFDCARVLGPPLRKLQQQATTRFEVVTRVHS